MFRPHTHKTESIVIKRIDFGEADQILTIFTKHLGKIHALAKGIRKINSKKSGSIDLLNWCCLTLSKGKNLDTLTEVEIIKSFRPLKENLSLVGYAYKITELTDSLTVENRENTAIFDLLTNTLECLTVNPRQIFVNYFTVQLLKDLGFWSTSQIRFSNPELIEILEILEQTGLVEIKNFKIKKNMGLLLERSLRYYIEEIIEKDLKSQRFIEKVRNYGLNG